MLLWREGVVEACEPRLPEENEIAWLHLENPSEDQVHMLLGGVFQCHPLALEDVLHFGQRPKLDHYTSQRIPQAFVTFYALDSKLDATEFCFIVSHQFVITVVREPVPAIDKLVEQAASNPDWMQSTGLLVYRLLDACVDDYFQVVDELEERVDEIEQVVFNHPERRVAPAIFHLKRRLHRLRRIVSDGRNVIGMMAHEAFPFTDDAHTVYFVDVFDHASRIVDAFDAIRDNLSGLLDLQTAQRANRMNEIMKTLTIISTIFLPLSFIVGLYGMNFHDIPEYNWPYGYAYVWALMILVTAVMLYYFKRKGWW